MWYEIIASDMMKQKHKTVLFPNMHAQFTLAAYWLQIKNYLLQYIYISYNTSHCTAKIIFQHIYLKL
jgi:hypothetical protein